MKKLCITTLGVFNGVFLSRLDLYYPFFDISNSIKNNNIISISLIFSIMITILFHLVDANTYFYQKKNRKIQSEIKSEILASDESDPIYIEGTDYIKSIFNASMILYFILYGIIFLITFFVILKMTFINVCLIFIFFMIVILLIRKQKKQKKQKNIFISYSTRDGIVTKDFLEKIHEKIKEKVSFNIYIDLLHNRKIDKQSHVIKKLLSSDYLVLLKTEYTDNSEWVQFELSLFNSMEKEIIELNIEDINENNTLASENMDKFLEKLKLLE